MWIARIRIKFPLASMQRLPLDLSVRVGPEPKLKQMQMRKISLDVGQQKEIIQDSLDCRLREAVLVSVPIIRLESSREAGKHG